MFAKTRKLKHKTSLKISAIFHFLYKRYAYFSVKKLEKLQNGITLSQLLQTFKFSPSSEKLVLYYPWKFQSIFISNKKLIPLPTRTTNMTLSFNSHQDVTNSSPDNGTKMLGLSGIEANNLK